MEQEAVNRLLGLLSWSTLFATGMVLLLAWMLVHVVLFGMKRLAAAFPRYRIQVAQGYPAIRIMIWTMATLIVVLVIVQPPNSIMFAVLGSIGLAVGLGAQDGIRNLLAGLMMIFNPPFRIGDMVLFGGQYGEVTGIDLSVTWLRTFDDSTIMVPNSEILRNAVKNSNSGALDELVETTVDLPLGVDLGLARTLAEEAARASPYTFLKKPVRVLVQTRYDHGFLVQLTIKAYVNDVRMERMMSSDITERLLQALFERKVVSPGLFAATGVGAGPTP